LGSPLIADGSAIGLKRERAGDGGGSALGRIDFGGAFGDPTAAGRGDLKFLPANGLAIEQDVELAFVR